MIVILRLVGLVVHDIRSLLKVGDYLDNLNEVSIGFKIRLNDLSHPCLFDCQMYCGRTWTALKALCLI